VNCTKNTVYTKFAHLKSKIKKKFSGKGRNPLPAHRTYIFAPSALELGVPMLSDFLGNDPCFGSHQDR